ncbi:TauD/TfdA dioxygenase family protein [Pseudomonas atacamensis]|uniref:TauD/TfdA dioxygenase family protein n=1 Tax=Pseudomonas atacamensis TaxID=2565368 RepID=UPI000F4740A7|nr:TauD/TfdA family dioxygenase [Pseudomonas atacamensis]MDT6920274.1 TauD/TfdA family dioxygenase [Pseudomonas atacamensis]RON68586.1 taurine dioxygenase [Pseudomonas fluorescens]ROO09106.1 taurine dioxygenase [Pseudomonas fluorescens]ROO17376.1 taurine dioxygenase [Pseudomonas fluorescens]
MSNAALAVKPVSHALEIHPVAGRIGAEIRGVHLSGELDAATVEAIQQALVEYKVLFFREQTQLDDQRQEAFAHLLGEPVAHPTVPSREGTRYLLELDGAEGQRANSWHTDVTFVDAYPKASILRSVVAPAFGGDTLWANTATAYSGLPRELRELADKLTAVHSNEYDYAGAKPDVSAEKLERYRKVFTSTVYETEHPVVRVHPISGEKSLLLGHFVKRIKGYSQADSAHLFGLLQSHVIRQENTVRWRWQAGDVAIWDNRSTQHYAIDDYGTQDRVVRRVTLKGEVPVGVNGQRSLTIKGPDIVGV